MRRMKLRRRRGQAMTELIILIAAVIIGLAWVAGTFPRAITNHFETNRDVLASPM